MSAAGNVLRHDAELREDRAAETADAELQPVQVVERVDLLAEPAAHLRAGIARRQRVDVELLVELVHQLDAAAVIHPGVLHAAVEPERHGGAEGESRILAQIIVARGVAPSRRCCSARRRRCPASARSRRCRKVWISNLPSVASETVWRNVSRRRRSCRGIFGKPRSAATSVPASTGRWPAWRARRNRRGRGRRPSGNHDVSR